MSGGYLPGMEPDPVDNERDRDLNVDRTPIPVASQILTRVAEVYGPEVFANVIDAGCGEGGWGRALRPLVCGSQSVGMDVREEAMDHARRNYDAAHRLAFNVDNARRVTKGVTAVIGNPPFSVKDASGKKTTLFPSFVRDAVAVVEPGGIVCFLALDDLGQRGGATRRLFSELPPNACFRITGAVGFRGPHREDIDGSGSTDQRSYCAWVWKADGDGGTVPGTVCSRHLLTSEDDPKEDEAKQAKFPVPGWHAENLPELPLDCRRWIHIPGTETP